MDLWVVAAAAGAGYIAKNLQNLTVDKNEGVLEPALKYPGSVQSESMNILQQIRYNTCPLRRLEQNRAHDDGDLASSSTGISGRRIPEFEDGESKNPRRLRRGEFIRSRRSGLNVARPLISLENGLDYEDGEGFEQNVFGMFPSVSTVRPLLVTDGTGLTSRSSSASSLALFDVGVEEGRRENIVGSKARSTMFRSHSMEHIDSVVLPRKPKKSSGLARMSGSADGVPHRLFDSPGPDGMLLFIMGMSIGILSAKTAGKREVDDMKIQLMQTQNLVQDLHDELNMKEMITVKEIVNEGYYQPPRKNDTPSSIREPIASPNKEAKESTKFETFKASDDNAENLKLRSKIEDELQAELEMLEHNMNASALENISNIVELDPDYEPDIAQGDLKPMMAVEEARDTVSESGDESTGTTTNISQPPNYAVSPRELSSRLHELIESRLEARIKELEMALSNSERRVQVLCSQGILSGTRLSFSETEYSCSPQSPINNSGHYTTDGSLVRNISSNSMDSINVANGTLARVADNKRERDDRNSSSSRGSDHEMDSTVQKLIDGLFNEEKKVSQHDAIVGKDGEQEYSVQDVGRTWDRQMSRSLMLDDGFESEDEEEADESEMLLIKKIVERRRSGSAFVFNFDEFRTQA